MGFIFTQINYAKYREAVSRAYRQVRRRGGGDFPFAVVLSLMLLVRSRCCILAIVEYTVVSTFFFRQTECEEELSQPGHGRAGHSRSRRCRHLSRKQSSILYLTYKLMCMAAKKRIQLVSGPSGSFTRNKVVVESLRIALFLSLASCPR